MSIDVPDNGMDPLAFVASASPPSQGRLVHISLHLSDRPLVSAGQRVEFGQPVVERFREQEALEIPTSAAIVGLRPGDVIDDVHVQRPSRLGRRTRQASYRARVIEHGRDGVTRLVSGSGETMVHTPTSGVVETLLPGRMDIRSEALAVDARIGWGRRAAGHIVVAADGPEGEVPATRIDVAMSGAILVVGSRLDIEATSRARALGVAAIVSGGISGRDLRQLAESEVRQQAALHAAAPFGSLAFSGYGRSPIPGHVWDLLVAAEGRPAGIDPAARTLLIGGDPATLLEAWQRPPGTVRVVSGDRRGSVGRLVGLAGQRHWPGAGYAPGGFVEVMTEAGRRDRVCVPLSTLERLG